MDDFAPPQTRRNRWGYIALITTLISVAVIIAIWVYAWPYLTTVTGWPGESFAAVRPYLLDQLIPNGLPGRGAITAPWADLNRWIDYYDLWGPFLAQLLAPVFLGCAAGAGVGVMLWTPGGAVTGIRHSRGGQLYDGPDASKRLARAAKAQLKGDPLGKGHGPHPGPWPERASRNSYLYCGSPGSGKSQLQISHLDRALRAGHRAAIHDVKGEYTRLFFEPYTVDGKTYAPILVGPADARSTPWAIAQDCRHETDCDEVACGLIAEGKGDPIWHQGARQILSGIFIGLNRERGVGHWGWPEISHLLKLERDDLTEYFRAHYAEGVAFLTGSKTTDSLIINVKSGLKFIHHLARAWPDSSQGISFRAWAVNEDHRYDNNPLLIIQGHQRLQQVSKALITSFLDLFAASVLSEGDDYDAGSRSTYLWLDEYAAIPKTAAVTDVLQRGRSANCPVVISCQSMAQVVERIGVNNADDLASMVQTWIVLGSSAAGSQGSNTADYLSRALGKREAYLPQRTRGKDGSTSESWQRSELPVVPADAIANLPLASPRQGINYYLWTRFAEGDVFKLNTPLNPRKNVTRSYVLADWLRVAAGRAKRKSNPLAVGAPAKKRTQQQSQAQAQATPHDQDQAEP